MPYGSIVHYTDITIKIWPKSLTLSSKMQIFFFVKRADRLKENFMLPWAYDSWKKEKEKSIGKSGQSNATFPHLIDLTCYGWS